MTGSLAFECSIGGVTAKIEAAATSGITKIIVPRTNMQDVLIDEKFSNMVEVVPVDSLDEVLEHALIQSDEKASLVNRLSKVVDKLTSVPDTRLA